MRIKPLVVIKSVRDYNVCEYWREQIDFMDKLIIKNYWHMSAHQIAREFFEEHKEYTHYIILGEDVICTPDHMRLLIDDILIYDFPVVAGYCNVDFAHPSSNISFRDLRKIVVRDRAVYQHPSILDLLLGKHGFPFVDVTFQGLVLTSIRRDVLEKLSYTPYRYQQASWIPPQTGCKGPYGTMFDLKISNDLQDLGIPIKCDLRLLVMHFAFGKSVINYAHKPRSVRLIKNDGTEKVIREEKPYAESPQSGKRQLTREEFHDIFIRKKKKEVVSEDGLKQSPEETGDTAKDS